MVRQQQQYQQQQYEYEVSASPSCRGATYFLDKKCGSVSDKGSISDFLKCTQFLNSDNKERSERNFSLRSQP